MVEKSSGASLRWRGHLKKISVKVRIAAFPFSSWDNLILKIWQLTVPGILWKLKISSKFLTFLQSRRDSRCMLFSLDNAVYWNDSFRCRNRVCLWIVEFCFIMTNSKLFLERDLSCTCQPLCPDWFTLSALQTLPYHVCIAADYEMFLKTFLIDCP